MPTDRYTRTVLTIIAIALVTIATRGMIITPAEAAEKGQKDRERVQKVALCDKDGVWCVSVLQDAFNDSRFGIVTYGQ